MNYERFNPSEEYGWYNKKNNSNYHLDFLYFFVGKHGLASHQNFTESYLDYLFKNWSISKNITNQNIQNYNNAWYFSSIDKNHFLSLSDKISLTNKMLEWGHYDHNVFIYRQNESKIVLEAEFYYVKEKLGFAGRGNTLVSREQLIPYLENKDEDIIVEEYLNRKIDFAITYIDENKFVIYENQVSAKGQYQGTVINSMNCYSIENFLSQKNVVKCKIEQFLQRFEKLKSFYKNQFPNPYFQGSFDFFIYENKNELFIHPGCEFNPRCTMGRIAYILKKNYLPETKVVRAEFTKTPNPACYQLAPAQSQFHYQLWP